LLYGPRRKRDPFFAKRGELLAGRKMDAKPVANLAVCHLHGVQVVAISANDVDSIEGPASDPIDEIDTKSDVDDLLLAIRGPISLKKFEAGDVPICALHR
jgi:hypothetical protein